MGQAAGLASEIFEDTTQATLYLSEKLIQRWFAPEGSYRAQLAVHLSDQDISAIQTVCQRQLQNQTVQWRSRLVFLVARISRKI